MTASLLAENERFARARSTTGASNSSSKVKHVEQGKRGKRTKQAKEDQEEDIDGEHSVSISVQLRIMMSPTILPSLLTISSRFRTTWT